MNEEDPLTPHCDFCRMVDGPKKGLPMHPKFFKLDSGTLLNLDAVVYLNVLPADHPQRTCNAKFACLVVNAWHGTYGSSVENDFFYLSADEYERLAPILEAAHA